MNQMKDSMAGGMDKMKEKASDTMSGMKEKMTTSGTGLHEKSTAAAEAVRASLSICVVLRRENCRLVFALHHSARDIWHRFSRLAGSIDYNSCFINAFMKGR